MTKQGRPGSGDYRAARILSGVLLVAIVAFMIVADAVSTTFESSPLVLVPILLASAAMFAVDVPGLGREPVDLSALHKSEEVVTRESDETP